MPWVLIPIIAIIAWAIVESQRHRSAGGAEFDRLTADLLERLENAEADRARLQQRVENLEAIVTSEAYEVERQARQALPDAERPLLDLDDTGVSDEEQVARRARRLREG